MTENGSKSHCEPNVASLTSGISMVRVIRKKKKACFFRKFPQLIFCRVNAGVGHSGYYSHFTLPLFRVNVF